MIVAAAIAWAVLSTAGGIAAALGWHRNLAELRRVKSWATHWQRQAQALAGFLARSESGYSRRGKHARTCQMQQDRARIAETAARLAAGK